MHIVKIRFNFNLLLSWFTWTYCWMITIIIEMVVVMVVSSVGLLPLVVSARRFVPSHLVFHFFLNMMCPLFFDNVKRVWWLWVFLASSLDHFFSYTVITILFIVTFTSQITADKFESLWWVGGCSAVHTRAQARLHFRIHLFFMMIIISKAHNLYGTVQLHAPFLLILKWYLMLERTLLSEFSLLARLAVRLWSWFMNKITSIILPVVATVATLFLHIYSLTARFVNYWLRLPFYSRLKLDLHYSLWAFSKAVHRVLVNICIYN